MFKIGDVIPFRLFGTSWTINFVKGVESSAEDRHWIFGNCYLTNQTINVSVQDSEGENLSDETIQTSALHEIVHSIFETGGYNNETENEQLVEWVARSLQALCEQGVFQQLFKE